MSLKSKAVAFAAAVTLVSGVGAAAAMSAGAATPSCGPNCLNIYNKQFGKQFISDVFRQGARTGQPIILFPRSNSDPAEDFTVALEGTVSDFYAAGLVSANVELHYGGAKFLNITSNTPVGVDEPAFELEYAPFGVDSGLCAGVPFTASQGENVSLQPCGVSAKTVWIWDTFDQPSPWDAFNGFTYPAINGSDTNFSHPFVLTYPRNGEPWAKPRPQLQVTNLTGFSNGFGPIVGQVPDSQLWGGTAGELK